MTTLRRTMLGLTAACSLTLGAGLAPAAAQTGSVTGVVTRTDGTPVGGVQVTVSGTSIATTTGTNGRYTLRLVPVGSQVILFRWLGYQPQQATVTITADATETIDVTLTARTINLGEIVVVTASRTPERVVEAPAAVSVITPVQMRNAAITGQAPTALTYVPGVDVAQSGLNDFNVNARGFNSSLNRRVLVLQDGRDLALAFLGSQEWNALSIPMDDMRRIEMVRGPGSALYGANAFAGVLNITTPAARDVVGTKFTLGGGELSTMRADFRHAGVSNDGRFGYRFNAGYYRSDSFTRARTALDGSDAAAEYGEYADTTGAASCTGLSDCLPLEVRPLFGQARDANTGVASGDPDPLQNVYGSGRLDYYSPNGSILTFEGGASRVENEVFVTGIGRVQVDGAVRPWARANFASENYNLMAWYSGRKTLDPQRSLGAGIPLEETSALFHVEGQYNRSFADDQARVVVGGSYRSYNVDTKQTLMEAANDNRQDDYFSAYGQLEYRPIDQLRFVAAARVDDGSLFDTQFSPKGAIVFSPNEDHSFRASVNRAFMTPNYAEFFVRIPAGAPTAQPAQLEGGIESFFATITDPATVGPSLAAAMSALNLTMDMPWDFAAQTEILGLGNENLEVEKVTGWEFGYKGNLSDRAYVSVDFYYNRLSNFVTDLLPAVNQQQYPSLNPACLSAPTQGCSLMNGVDALADLQAAEAVLIALQLPPTHPLRVAASQLIAGYQALAASGLGTAALATLPNGDPAVVVSYANAGRVDEKGVEVGVGYGITPELRIDGSYTYFQFDVKDNELASIGADLTPNTPKHKGSIGITYTGESGVDLGGSVKFVDAFDWAAGIFSGKVPSQQTVDLNAGYRVNNNLRIFVSGTNVLDQERFQIYGGSVIGRRILGGVTATF